MERGCSRCEARNELKSDILIVLVSPRTPEGWNALVLSDDRVVAFFTIEAYPLYFVSTSVGIVSYQPFRTVNIDALTRRH